MMRKVLVLVLAGWAFVSSLAFCSAVPAVSGSPVLNATSSENPSRLVGGCQTVGVAYGLASYCDSTASETIRRLLAPSTQETHVGGDATETGEAGRAAVPLFVQIGAVDDSGRDHWRALAQQVSERLGGEGLTLASRTLLLHTTGPCFPPYHVDFQAWGDSLRVNAFLDSLPLFSWKGFSPAGERSGRDFFISGGTSLQLMDRVIDLRREKR